MRIRSVLSAAAIAVVLVLGSAGVAAAQTVPWDSVDLVIHDDNGKQLMILAGQVATETALPAEVELAVPAGLALQWAGEILGGDVANDPTLQTAVTKSGTSDIYRFTLSKSRTAQLELAADGAVRLDGSKYAATVTWTPSQDLRELKIGFRIPAGAQIATPVDGAARVPGPAGFDYYRSTLTNLKAGAPVTFAFAYTVPAVAGAGSGSSASGGNSAAVGIIAVLLALVGALLFAVWRKMQGQGAGSTAASAATAKGSASRASSGTSAGAKAAAAKAAKTAKPASDSGRAAGSKRGLVVVGVVAALVIGAVVAVNASTKPQDQGDVITRTFSQADPCTSTVVPLAVTAGGDMNGAAEKLFGVLQTLPSITTAKVYKDQPRIEVGYCESSLQPGQVEQALSATGLVAKPQ